MTKRNDIDATGADGATGPQAAPDGAPAVNPSSGESSVAAAAPETGQPKAELPNTELPKAATLGGLPAVESPSISPAGAETASDEADLGPAAPIPGLPAIMPQPAADGGFDAGERISQPQRPPFGLRSRHKRYAKIAASVAIGAIFGAIGGTLLTGGLATAPKVDLAAQEQKTLAAQEEAKAMQQSVARLTKEVTTLKANLDATNKFTHSQVASIDKKLAERLKRESTEITGSISAPQTVAAAPAAAPAAPPAIAPVASAAAPTTPVPVPTPRPRLALADIPTPAQARVPVVRDWSIHDARGGYLYVVNRGEIYQIQPGVPLPGLGPVESIKRQEGRWVVTTPKGIIVTMRDRRYFE